MIDIAYQVQVNLGGGHWVALKTTPLFDWAEVFKAQYSEINPEFCFRIKKVEFPISE